MPSSTPFPVKGTRVRFTKLAEKNPGVIDVGYWTEGTLLTDVALAESVWMARDRRRSTDAGQNSAVSTLGTFNTSRIEKIGGGEGHWTLITRNSTWQLEVIP